MSDYLSFSFHSMALFILLVAFASLLASPTLSTSLNNNVEPTGFTAVLNHVDQGKSLTKTELLQRAVQRRERRQATMAQLVARTPLASINTPLQGDDGEFYMTISIGTPPVPHRLIVDSDSDVTWTNKCNTTSTSYFKLQCNSRLCKASKSGCNKNGVCQSKYEYANSTFPVDLATETFTLNGNVKLANLGFGCAISKEGDNETGAVSLGRGPLSLPSQLNAKKLALCPPSYDHSEETGFVSIGSAVKSYHNLILTRLVRNPRKPSGYYISLEGISINNVRLQIDKSAFAVNGKDGSGGVVLDTGSTMTYLEQSVFNIVANEIRNQIKLRTTSADEIGLPLCFTVPPHQTFLFPNITLHFSPWSKLQLRLENSFREYPDESTKQNKSCLAMAPSPPSDRGMSRLGNMQLQNTLVVFDLVQQTVAFRIVPQCNGM